MARSRNGGVASLIAYVSRFTTLYPGDLIATGTSQGVGLGQKPPLFLKPRGSELRLAVEGLGIQHQKVYAWNADLLE